MVKKKASLALLPLTLCFSSLPVLAATTADLEKRLEQQEKQIKRLENRLKGTRAAVKENRSRLSDAADRLKVNGFMTAGVAVNDGDDVVEPFYDIDDDYSSAAVSKAGVQFTFEVSESFDATVQLVSKGTNDYQVEAEWAYLSYQATNNLSFKFGRQRIPYYILSEYLDVGYALPWVIAPIELYNIPLSATDGISGTYTFDLGGWGFAWQAYAGSGAGRSDQLEADFEQNQSFGTNLVAEWNSWTFRVGYNQSNLKVNVDEGGLGDTLIQALNTADDGLAATYGVSTPSGLADGEDNIRTQYISSGFMYDDGSLMVMGELANLSAETFQPVGDAGYLTVGYRFGKWMPHVTYAKFQTDSKADDRIRDIQAYADSVGKAIYSATGPLNPAAPTGLAALNGAINAQLGLPSTTLITPAEYCAAPSAGACSSAILTQIGVRDQLLEAVQGYSESLYNSLESQIQEQQSYTIGVVYDVSPRVKAKLQATHYENFGENTYQTLDISTVGGNNFLGNISTSDGHSNGRFSGDPDAAGNHTAIYSFSIDAVF